MVDLKDTLQDKQECIDAYDEIIKNRDERISKAIGYMNNYIEVEDAPINERIKIEFKEVLNILNGDDKE